ncbi:hypothetical protein [Pseudomonas sp. WS 5414]|uniref:hypothetical protein n=1 Tax=Pseudomonas TaxID=286 RepID=UPI00147435B0|nr:hypothetical protein [Pseudomonas sp. WS 5414]NMY71340.1 hypothetical protein [Pseudomonas sp. WS 5414]
MSVASTAAPFHHERPPARAGSGGDSGGQCRAFQIYATGTWDALQKRPAPDGVESTVLHGGFLSGSRPSLLAACTLVSDRLRAHLEAEKMLCPECEQGEVTKVQVRATQEILYVCQECESLWLTAEVMATEPFNCFTSYMEELGLPPRWSSLYVLEPVSELLSLHPPSGKSWTFD